MAYLEYIKSGKNPFYKEIKKLRDKKNRTESGLFVVEGLRFVDEAIKSGIDIRNLLMTEDFYRKLVSGSEDDSWRALRDFIGNKEGLRKEEGGPVLLEERLFQDLSSTDNPQGILAVARIPVQNSMDALEARLSEWNFVLLLDSLQDPGNMGTIIRTGYAAGVDAIILSEGCVDVYNPKTLRATMGSVFHVPLARGPACLDIVRKLQAAGFRVFASHLRGAVSLYDADFSGKTALIIGNEAQGIDDSVASAADCLVKIPMPGRAESLNASVAAGILMFEIARKKRL